ncbi:MAG: dockerin type I domain-containing protein [Ruminococcus flavefaciens]|nr:dockerin type I domain-containing protein [Ruminococcus flavefaciens]MCM1229519.1 dockerin type I domain-containing protein [Ruminococcus flavefaciens]
MYSKFMRKAGAAVMAAAMALNGTAISISSVVAADEPAKYEFEDGTFTGTVSATAETGASGGKVARMEDDGTVSIDVEVPSTGMYAVTIYAQGIGGSKIQNLAVNDVDQGQISISDSGFEPISMTVKLNEGKNTVTISKSWGWTNFDYLTVESAQLAEIKATQTTCCDVEATDETRALMSYLASVYGNGIISGQQEIYQYGPHDYEQEFEYLNNLTGHYPAIRGFDYGNRCCVLFGQNDDGSTDRAIDWVKNKNGIATASFHLNVPNDFASYTLGTTLDFAKTTYSQNTDFSPSKAATEGTKENEYYLDALEVLAKEFKKLEAEGVPVLWRPLHEAEGGGGETGSWFWWGREGSEAYKELWKYTYKTLTETYGCHNLIWVWNSYNYEYSQDWYPGDEYVDIIGYDKYNCTDWSTGSAVIKHNDSAISSTFYGIMEKYDSAKMVAMAENDSFSTVDNLTSEKAGWLYFMTWYDGGSPDINFVSDPRFNTEQDTIDMYQSEYCITLDELPADLYTKETPKPDPIETKPTTTADPSKTTTTVTTEADPTKNYGKVIYDKTKKSYQVTLPEASKDFYIDVELPENIEYANGGLGVTVELDGEYYWANIQWEAKKSGSVAVNVVDNFLNCSLGTDVIEDEALIEKIKAELGKATVYEGQVWYAQEDEKSASTDGVKIVSAYLKNDSGTTTTVTPGGETVEVTLLGDANEDGVVDVADAAAIIQHLGNKDKYALSAQGAANADCYNPGDGVTGMDALAIQKLKAKMISELPEIE